MTRRLNPRLRTSCIPSHDADTLVDTAPRDASPYQRDLSNRYIIFAGRANRPCRKQRCHNLVREKSLFLGEDLGGAVFSEFGALASLLPFLTEKHCFDSGFEAMLMTRRATEVCSVLLAVVPDVRREDVQCFALRASQGKLPAPQIRRYHQVTEASRALWRLVFCPRFCNILGGKGIGPLMTRATEEREMSRAEWLRLPAPVFHLRR